MTKIRANPFIHEAKLLFRLSEHAIPKNAIHVDRHDLYEGEKTEEFKKQTVRQTKKGGRRPRRSLRIRSGLTFLYLCIYEIYARSPLYPARMIKNKHARFFAISHRRTRDVPNKKSRPMLARGCGNTCHRFTVIPFPVRNAFTSSLKKIQLDTGSVKKRALFSESRQFLSYF